MTRKTLLLTICIALFALFALGLSLSGEPAGSVVLAQADKKAGAFDPAKHEDANLRPILRGKKLNEGENLIHTAAGGVKVSAKVKGGKIVDFIIADSRGVQKSTLHQQSGVSARRATKPVKEGEMICWQCYVASDGNTHCFQIPCPTPK